MTAAAAATRVPAEGAEAEAWRVYGWAEVALGCAVLDRPELLDRPEFLVRPEGVAGPAGFAGPAAFAGLDEVIAAYGVRCGGPAAARLRAIRGIGGPVPRHYPVDDSPGPVPPIPGDTWRLCSALAAFCDELPLGAGSRPVPGRAEGSAGCEAGEHLRWGERYRPSARSGHVVVAGAEFGGMVRRTWMRLPGHAAVLVDVPRRGSETYRRVWRGIHDGAHLDHLALAGDGPYQAEFGRGLLAAESYAMAVELVALLESVERGEDRIAACLRDGVAERIGRLPGFPGSLRPEGETLRRAAGHQSAELAALPLLAATYVSGPLRLLAGDGSALPGPLRADLLARWTALTGRWPAARRLMDAVREIQVASTPFVVQLPPA